MGSKKTTMTDVAELAKVSATTVSHVINKTRFVEKETEERVLSVIKKLNYKPNVFARSLKGKGTSTVGIIIGDIRESYFANVVQTIESKLDEEDFNLILCDSEDDEEKEIRYIDILIQKGIDGLIFAPVNADKSYEMLKSHTTQVVQIDRMSYKHNSDYVGIDNVKSAEEATDHLLEHGYKKIGFIGQNEKIYTMKKRTEGFRNALLRKGVFNQKLIKIVESQHHNRLMKNAIKKWFNECGTVDAILCGVDNICYETIIALEEEGIRIGADVGIISYDDMKWFRCLKTPITAIRQPTEKIGVAAVELLIDRIRHHTKNEYKKIILNSELIIRESCGEHK